MKDLDYGKDYQYAHDFEDAYISQEYLPGKLQGSTYYIPTERGYEKVIKERMEQWRKLQESMNAGNKKKKGET
jgi:putative ATPase